MGKNKTLKEIKYPCFFEEKIKSSNKVPSWLEKDNLSEKDIKRLTRSFYSMRKAFIKMEKKKSDNNFLYFLLLNGLLNISVKFTD